MYYLSLDDTKFTWDPRKAASNERKHGVTFDEAATVFEDIRAYYEEDKGADELRVAVIGYSAHGGQDPMSGRSTKRAKARREDGQPSKASLAEIPPIESGRFLGRGKEGLAKAKELFRARRRGRPAKGETAEGTVAKTVRLPQSTYDELVRLAEVQGISAHVALRKAVAKWIVEARKRVA